jgi:hypothetical protein
MSEDALIEQALAILARRIQVGDQLISPGAMLRGNVSWDVDADERLSA